MEKPFHTATTARVISDTGSFTEFYKLTNKLSQTRHVRFTGKNDEADNIEWCFTYRGHKLMLQYNIYTGVSLHTTNSKDLKAAEKLAVQLLKH